MTNQRTPSKRLVAWIDGVGGYLICLGDEIGLGQPSGAAGVEVPILADLSRRHASIRREGEDYVVAPVHRVSVDGKPLAGPMVLQSGALLELGDSVKVRFHKPHALSATAVLTLESHHKTNPAVDRIILMSESCILGPQQHSHIQCRDWTQDLVLFRRGDALQFRTSATVEFDSQSDSLSNVVAGTCRIEGEGFALSFEEI